ncbi:Hemerythrin HHE cation binding domain-containing protein [Streptomyces sp. OV198]|jgi:hemerythrin superfamily protein|uniref:hemerythrin domain-containing protein n=1 Tax=Streptomyces sp. OV198 TaxID=1882787 RepID=UPI000BCFA3A0|nr:hemerythrin domain-containing protein [Streptomyces sp. OV198]SOF02140.1 Hemerythrin HHE cation binding domain-containing protein [Streptomyces sp. OV198]
MGHGGNVFEELMADHREVEEIFGRIQAMTVQGQGLRDLVDEVTIELVRHSVAEEQHLYPAVREYVEGGDRLADKELADHGRVENLLKQLERMDTEDPQMSPVLQQLMDEVAAHVEDEENNLFPMLRQACSSEMLGDLGDRVRRAKAMAPTRPHPSAPDTPPANKLLAPGADLVDRARDFVTGRGRS